VGQAPGRGGPGCGFCASFCANRTHPPIPNHQSPITNHVSVQVSVQTVHTPPGRTPPRPPRAFPPDIPYLLSFASYRVVEEKRPSVTAQGPATRPRPGTVPLPRMVDQVKRSRFGPAGPPNNGRTQSGPSASGRGRTEKPDCPNYPSRRGKIVDSPSPGPYHQPHSHQGLLTTFSLRVVQRAGASEQVGDRLTPFIPHAGALKAGWRRRSARARRSRPLRGRPTVFLIAFLSGAVP
jgi:hypothetical protein